MRKTFVLLFSALCAICALPSCNKNGIDSGNGVAVSAQGVKDATLNVRITAGNAFTKATTASEGEEASVSKIEVLVFNENGGIDAYKASVGSALTVTGISSSNGAKTIVAVVNAPAVAGVQTVTSLSELRAITSHFKADNDTDSFVMYGEQGFTLVPSAVNDVTVNVDRLAARIRIDKITRNFGDAMPGLQALTAADFQIIRMYLTNVADDTNLGAPVFPVANSTWVTDESSLALATPVAVPIDKDELVYGSSVTTGDVNQLGQGDSYVNTHRFYAYPNPSASQVTKLVIECRIAGQYYTYPVAFEGIQPNTSYEIRNLTITRLGNPSNGDDNIDPDEPVDPIVAVDFDIDLVVNPWTLVLMGEGADGNITI